ncbi:MAG TPA: flagellar biosynthesis protein FlhB [Xanthobacteraceae bacterium]|nr:flagellar biosynthesis protein FlhB [Xanthobacteraceae bacterium]
MADERDASERTEDPTPRRLEEAIRRGDVVKSAEVNTWFLVAAGALMIMVFAAPTAASLQTTLRGLLADSYQIRTEGPALAALVRGLAMQVVGALGIPLILLVIAALAGNFIQHRFVFSVEPVKPQLSRISPAAGLARLFSGQALANFAKGLAKLCVVGAVMTALVWPQRRLLGSLITADPAAILPFATSLALRILGTVVAILAVVAAADYLFQYQQWYERQKMSLREIKEEFRQSEGDPAVKGKLRQLRHSRMRKRMMAAVPKASVVITNPTHFAVALKYERGMNAPVCVAKGVDLIARRIREVAEEHDVPVVENPPLARALHGTVEIDQEIPPEHYRAVAEIIGYIMRLRGLVGRPRRS